MSIFSSSQKIGEIVSIMPRASEIFKHYNIDFCCGGDRPLSAAIREQNLDEWEILNKLEKSFEENKKNNNMQTDFRKMSIRDLIDHIESAHHVYVKKVLPELSQLTTKILRVHGENHNILFKVHKLFHGLKTELEQHLIKEEEVLFPQIKAYEKEPCKELLNKVEKVIREIESEHNAAGDILKELRNITDQYTVPDDGCNTYILTYLRLEELETDLFQHIHLENNILFKKIEC